MTQNENSLYLQVHVTMFVVHGKKYWFVYSRLGVGGVLFYESFFLVICRYVICFIMINLKDSIAFSF